LYDWGHQQVSELLEDLYKHFDTADDPDSEYLLNTILTRDTGTGLEIIDGQQRLTTVFMIFAALRSHGAGHFNNTQSLTLANIVGKPDGNSMIPSLRDQYENGDAQGFILALANGERDPQVPTSSLAQPLQRSYRQICNWLVAKFPLPAEPSAGDPIGGRLLDFVEMLRKRVKIVEIRVGSLADGWRAFERANDRGKPLEGSDLLKSDLFNKADSAADRDMVAQNWKRLLDTLRSAGRRVSPDLFLHHLALADIADSKISMRDTRSTWKDQISSTRSASALSKDLADGALAYVRILRGECPSDGSSCVPLLDMAQTHRLDRFRQVIPLLLAGRSLNAALFSRLATQCETFAVVAIVTGERGQGYEGDLAAAARKLRERLAAGDTHEGSLEDFLSEDFAPLLQQRSDDFRSALNSTTQTALGVRFTKYLLFRVEDYLQRQAQPALPRVAQKDRLVATHDEHILPESRPAALVKVFGGKDLAGIWVDRLGNLTLWEGGPNSSHQNAAYEIKRSDYGNSKFLMTKALAGQLQQKGGQQRIGALISPASTWTSSECKGHHKELIALIFAALELSSSVSELPEPAAAAGTTSVIEIPPTPKFDHIVSTLQALKDGARSPKDIVRYLDGINTTGVVSQVLRVLDFFGMAEQVAGRGSDWVLSDLGEQVASDGNIALSVAETVLDHREYVAHARSNSRAKKLLAAAKAVLDAA
jgi:hypothetical protein